MILNRDFEIIQIVQL